MKFELKWLFSEENMSEKANTIYFLFAHPRGEFRNEPQHVISNNVAFCQV